jgi:Zn-dependent protease with chaperone function
MKNFFEHQDEARRNTRNLIVLMALGVLAMGTAIYVLLVVVRRCAMPLSADVLYPAPWFEPNLFVGTLVGTALIVVVASASRTVFLRGGGSRVAEMLGGRLVSGGPRDVLEKRFVNVLEEMSIASGMPVPQAFVLDGESGINAFAAGMSTNDAVVAVTRGCLEKLTREELQGVIAHEMSHITHGDMRINMRLMGVVFGIVCIALLGRLLLRVAASGRPRRRGRDDEGSLGMVFLAIGVGLLVIGSVGEMFGKLIKSAIGRQREYLADASAVQFTRNPAGIGGALKKIGGFSAGSHVVSARAEEASHMFFSDIHQRFSGLFATHPPLDERIRRIDPGFDGVMLQVGEGVAQPEEVAGFSGDAAVSLPAPLGLIHSVGTLTPDAVSQAQQWLASLPPALRDGVGNSFSAVAIALSMLWPRESDNVIAEREVIERLLGASLLDATERFVPIVREVPRSRCLALAELLSPALHALSSDQRHRCQQAIRGLIEVDQRETLFEHLLGEILVASMSATPRRVSARRLALSMVRAELELLLSLLAQGGAATQNDADASFAHAAARLPELRMRLLPPADGQIKGLSHCLSALHAITPSAAARVIDAMAHCALADHKVTTDEATLVAATCLALEIPLPPWA